MGRSIVDIAHISINAPSLSKNIELDTVVSWNVSETSGHGKAKTMNRRRRPLGHTHGVKDVSIDATVVVQVGDADIDWRELLRTGDEFEARWEEGDDGKRFAAKDCVVTEVGMPFDEGGETKMTVKIEPLDVVPLT